MGKFDNAVLHTLGLEGVFSDDANDRGGATRFGITHGTLAIYQQKFQKLQGRNIRSLTREEAIDIYRALYWRYDDIHSPMIATELFDIGVNGGLTTATLIAQRAVNFHPKVRQIAGRQVQPLVVDGLWGPSTRDAINALSVTKADRLLLFKALVLFQAKRYCEIVIGNPTQLDFIDGWLRRAALRPQD